jgi:N-methylhydantoinase A
VTVHSDKVEFPALARRGTDGLQPLRTATIRHIYGEDSEAPAYMKPDLRCGDVIAGPAVIQENLSTTYVGKGQQLSVGGFGEFIITVL